MKKKYDGAGKVMVVTDMAREGENPVCEVVVTEDRLILETGQAEKLLDWVADNLEIKGERGGVKIEVETGNSDGEENGARSGERVTEKVEFDCVTVVVEGVDGEESDN